jgi:hypothetical protein
MLGKERSILAVFFLTIITLGIYWLVWYYMVNEEMRRHSRSIDVAPGLAVICQFIPIVNLVSRYNTADRILTIQRECNEPGRISPLAAILFAIFIPFGIYTYMIQSSLNNHWRWHRQNLAGAQGTQAQVIP